MQRPEMPEGEHLSTVLTPAMGAVTERGGGEVLAAVVLPKTDREGRETGRGREAPAKRREEKETRGESEGTVVETARKKGVGEAEWILPETDGDSAPAPGRQTALHLTMLLKPLEKRKKRQNRKR